MSTISQVRTGLKARLDTVDGLRVAMRRPDQINTPTAVIRRTGSPSRDTFSGRGHHVFEILLMVAGSDLERRQAELDQYTDLSGTKSVRAALEAGNTLGGVAEYISVGDWDMDADQAYQDIEYMGARLPVEVAVRY